MGDLRFVCVSGFFASGSSAVVDLLKEMDRFYECESEIRIIKDPYGISQLEIALVDQWELINSTVAISDFLWLCKVCSREQKNLLSPSGLGYSRTICKDFMKYIDEYIDSIIEYKYKGEFYSQKFKKPYLRFLIDKLRFGIERISKRKLRFANRNIPWCYLANPTHEKFNQATRRLFDNLFLEKKEKGYNTIILDQAVSPNNPSVIHKYFNDAKMIVVDRDPRDMYTDDLNCGVILDDDYQTSEAGKRYVYKQKMLRSSLNRNDDNILYIRFEDMILNYEIKKKEIMDFLGLKDKDHIYKQRYFNPNESRKNIGIWKEKKEKCKDAFDEIEKMRVDYPELFVES